MWRAVTAVLVVLFVYTPMWSGCTKIESGGTPPPQYRGAVTRILEDNVHSTLQSSSIRLSRKDYRYQASYGYSRLFDQLHKGGYHHDRLRRGRLHDELLAAYDVLFINLLDDSRPDFSKDEIAAVWRFVSGGKGLFVIADHTNVYRHAERMNRILQPMGVDIRYETAIDRPPHTITGKGWLIVSDLRPHPVTAGVTRFSILSGGPINGSGGVAFTSAKSWADKWNPDMSEGFFGNWKKDENEQRGPLPVVQATTYGKGRVVVVGDQNVFGDGYLLFLDNAALALNALEWLAGRSGEEPPLRNHPWPGFNIRFDAPAGDYKLGRNRKSGHFTFYYNCNRTEGVFAHATARPLAQTPDAVGWVEPGRTVAEETWNEVGRVLTRAGQVLLVFDPAQMNGATADILRRLGLTSAFSTSSGQPLLLRESTLHLLVLKDLLNNVSVSGSPDSVQLPRCPAIRCPGYAVHSATSAAGETCDLLCSFPSGGGRVLVSPAAALLRNDAMGKEHDPPTEQTLPFHQLQTVLIDELLRHANSSRAQR